MEVYASSVSEKHNVLWYGRSYKHKLIIVKLILGVRDTILMENSDLSKVACIGKIFKDF